MGFAFFLLSLSASVYRSFDFQCTSRSEEQIFRQKIPMMSSKPAASLSTLPIEVLHQIFDDLDAPTIIWSIRNVCQRFQAAADIYHRHTLDLTSVSKPVFQQLLNIVPPQAVTALTLFKRDTTPREVEVFRSLVNIDLFTRLRSLTLLNIDGSSLCRFLRHARRCSLTSLTLRSHINDPNQKREIVQHLSSIIGQPNLVRLAALDCHLSVLMNELEWPNQPTLRHLTVAWNYHLPMSKILDRLPNLTTLVLNEESEDRCSSSSVSEERFSTTYSRLTSLTISNKWRLLTYARSLLSHTPSLTYLKITGARDSIIDGSRWEELIKTKLPALTKFEFHEISNQWMSNREISETLLNRVMVPFRSPFWTEEKRWLVIGTWHPVDQRIEIYTPLVCTPDYLPSCRPKTITMTNFDTQGQYYTKYEDVLRLQLVSCGLDHSINSPVYPNVSELSVAMDRFNSLGSVPAGLDLSNVTKLSLSLSSILPEDEMMFAGLKSLFRQTPNIHTLEFSGRLFVQIDKKPVVQICLGVIDYVDPSKLRYLTLPVIGFHDVRKLLQQFRDLSSVKFDLRGLWTEYGEIVKYLRTLTEDYSIKEDDSSMFVEVCRRPEMTNVGNESNGINHREARSLFSNRNRRTTDFSRWETDSLAERTLENTSMDRNWS